MLTALPSEDEVREATFGLSKESAPGPDGFTGLFFTTCWEMIKGDILAALTEFFNTPSLPRAYTSSFLVLIAKKDHAEMVTDFRPISLCNLIYQILARILNNRLSTILPLIISDNQGAFVRGRNIAENIGMAQELTNDINRKVVGSNVILKLDMADRLDWNFLFDVLTKFGFCEKWITFIKKGYVHQLLVLYLIQWRSAW